jgi:DNA ligase-1
VRYQIVAEAYRDLEGATARLELIDRLAALFRQTPTDLLPTVALLCQGQIAPDFAGVELGLAERLAARAVAQATGVTGEQVLASAREVGDLGLAAEALLAALAPRPPSLEVAVVFEGLHQVAQAQGTPPPPRRSSRCTAPPGGHPPAPDGTTGVRRGPAGPPPCRRAPG